MKKVWKYGLVLAGLLAAVAAQQLATEPSQGIFYRVMGGKNEMYLLGSIHVGSREMYPMGKRIQKALKTADTLVFECDTTSPESKNTTAQMMKSEDPLSSRISTECYDHLKLAAQKLGYTMTSLEHLEPWAITSMLTVAAAAQELNVGSSRIVSALGVENVIRKHGEGKSVNYLETAEAQLELMENFSPALQEYLLSNACQAVLEPEKITGMDQDMNQWPEWWKNGNAQAFADSYAHTLSVEESPELAQEYHQALMTTRNQKMAEKLQVMLEEEKDHTYLVTVGLMHLVLPEDSIIAELRSMGYTVDQIIN